MYVTTLNNTNIASAISVINKSMVEKHLSRVIERLKAKTNIPEERRLARENSLANLEEYISLGNFPKNTIGLKRRPIFKDEFGNYCAVGYLLHKAGRDDIVDSIMKTDNFIYVDTITEEKYLAAILSLGLTKEETAQIQPTYGWEEPSTISTIGNISRTIQIVGIFVFLVFQVFALGLVKELNLTSKQKRRLYLVLLSGSSLVLVAIWAITQVIDNRLY